MLQHEDEDSRTIFCGNLSDKVTEALLYELFLQGGPLEKVSHPKDKDGRARAFAFITYVHAVSVPYAVSLFQGTQLFNREIKVNPRNAASSNAQPKVDTSQLNHQSKHHPTRNPNPFDQHQKFVNGGNGFNRDKRGSQTHSHGSPYEQSPLRSGFNPVPTKASMQMQPQHTNRFSNQPSKNPSNSSNSYDFNKLIAMGQNMMQSNSNTNNSTTHNFDVMFIDRDDRAGSDRRTHDSKVSNRHSGGRSHYRDEPYSRRDRDTSRHHRNGSDRRRY
ncbi:RNA-binding protein 7 [Pseudolycoriella hygida]|uniref:RNA-binding protein 7 n=1 Tax=Pseudolycoriella hygida TaxID=35572 RepID=A0A9Q0N9M9_9DIPT|nr:RNA-binding protein 7 [Pseudolycoriella hygida]